MNKKSFKEKKEKIFASLVLGSYLDTLGFFNGVWEFNYNMHVKTLQDALLINYEIIHKFFSMGGFSMNISHWNASDDTIMIIATMKACKKGGKLKDFIQCYIDILPQLEEKKRASGITTLNSLRILKKNPDINKISYSSTMGGNGAAMRTHYIGIYFDSIDKIIEISILSSRLTHNHPVGFLGGMVTALFTHYALQDIEPWKWCDMLLKLNEDGTIDKIVSKMPTPNFNKYMKDKEEFWNIWYKYKEFRLNKFELKGKEFSFGSERFLDLLKICYDIKNFDNIPYDRMGGSGATATIIAYDSILMSIINKDEGEARVDLSDNNYYYNWESMVFHSTLHFGDNDTIGTIAGCWYGALRGFDNFNKDTIEQLEFIDELKKY